MAGAEALLVQGTADALMRALANPPQASQNLPKRTWDDVARDTLTVLRSAL